MISLSGDSTLSLSNLGSLSVDNLNLDGNTIISTNTNGNIIVTPNGTGLTSISSNLLIGGTTAITNGTKSLGIFTGTAPSAVAADSIAIYSSDVSAGNTTISLYTEGTPVASVSPTSPNRTIAIRVNGTLYYLHAKTTND